MVLDPMSALSLASNIVQFVDFSSKLVSKGYRIYLSADGALPKNLELEVVTSELSQLTKKLCGGRDQYKVKDRKNSIEPDHSLQEMSDECSKIADELLTQLARLKVKSDAKHRGWKSLRQALKSVWNKDQLDELAERLSLFRNQLQFHILVSIKESAEFQSMQQTKQMESMDVAMKSLLDSLLNNETIFTSEIGGQTMAITDLHLDTRAVVEKEAKKTRTEILSALKLSVTDSQHLIQCNTISHHVTDSWEEHFKLQDIILQSLSFPTMNDRYETIEEAHAETFEWIFRKPCSDTRWDDFSDWLERGHGIYWVSGKAGSGKSTLMRYVRDNPRTETLLKKWTFEGKDLFIASFFFWISGVADQSSQVGLLRSLLWEILSMKPHLIEATLPGLWSALRSSISPIQYSQKYSWTPAKVTSAFKRLFSILSQDADHVFLLIDGLDEYSGDSTDTIRLLQSIISPNVKICISSRPWQIFEVAFQKAPKLRLQDLTFGDIKCYVNDKLGNDDKMRELCNIDPVGAPKLVEEIVQKAEGVFLWVTLVVKSFLHGLTNGDRIAYLRKRLEEIPSEIEDLFNYMLSKVEPVYYEEGRIIFSVVWLASHTERHYEGNCLCSVCLFFAVENEEALKAPAKSLDEAQVLSKVKWANNRLKVCCAGLLELYNTRAKRAHLGALGNQPVGYIHRTARDFFAATGFQKIPAWARPRTTDHIPTRMMRANILHLRHGVVQNELQSMVGLLRAIFSRTMWLACKAERETGYHNAEILDAFRDSASQFFNDSIGWGNLTEYEPRCIRGIEWCDDFLSLAILSNLSLYVNAKLGSGNQVLESKKGRPYLDYALRLFGDLSYIRDQWDLETICVLLNHGGNPNLNYTVSTHGNSRFLSQSTPWEAVLHHVDMIRHVTTDDSIKPSFQSDASFPDENEEAERISASFIASLLALLLKNGANPSANTLPMHGWCGRDVSEVILHAFQNFPEEREQLLALLQPVENQSLPNRVHRKSRLATMLKFRKLLH